MSVDPVVARGPWAVAKAEGDTDTLAVGVGFGAPVSLGVGAGVPVSLGVGAGVLVSLGVGVGVVAASTVSGTVTVVPEGAATSVEGLLIVHTSLVWDGIAVPMVQDGRGADATS